MKDLLLYVTSYKIPTKVIKCVPPPKKNTESLKMEKKTESANSLDTCKNHHERQKPEKNERNKA